MPLSARRLLPHEGQTLNQIGSFERHLEEEPQRDNRAIDARRTDLVPRHMQLKKAKVLARRRVGRAAEKNCEVLDVTDVILLDLLLEMTDRHVFDHALAQRADGLVDHGDAPVSHELPNPIS
jgi:hypothetical protein